jgi:indole-3-glycerol phosphate synthase
MNILDQIIEFKKLEVSDKKSLVSISTLEKSSFFSRETISLRHTLESKTGPGIIAEFKRRSPSKGIINEKVNVVDVTIAYTNHGASGLSVLTDNNFFGGSSDDLVAARINKVPILRKDFIIDEYQIIEAKAIGADIILLIAACLTPSRVKKLANAAKNLQLEVLLELHDEKEVDHICDEVDLIGVNNRNLKTFTVDLDQSVRLAEMIGNGKLKIAESGISSKKDINFLKEYGFDGFLIGEYFMKQQDPGESFEKFMYELESN